MAGSVTTPSRSVDVNLTLIWDITNTEADGWMLTCVCSITCQLALLLPVLGYDRLCEAKEVLQGTAVRAAR
jgi:hypothetical protein